MSLAWHGIRLRKRMRTPTFWLALMHITLMCCVKLRFSSIFTPSSLICSVLMISSLAMVSLLSASMFLGLIIRDSNLSGFAKRKLFLYHNSACWPRVSRVDSTSS